MDIKAIRVYLNNYKERYIDISILLSQIDNTINNLSIIGDLHKESVEIASSLTFDVSTKGEETINKYYLFTYANRGVILTTMKNKRIRENGIDFYFPLYNFCDIGYNYLMDNISIIYKNDTEQKLADFLNIINMSYEYRVVSKLNVNEKIISIPILKQDDVGTNLRLAIANFKEDNNMAYVEMLLRCGDWNNI